MRPRTAIAMPLAPRAVPLTCAATAAIASEGDAAAGFRETERDGPGQRQAR